MDCIFPGNDDDFDAEDLQEVYQMLDREQSALDYEDICTDASLQSVGSPPGLVPIEGLSPVC